MFQHWDQILDKHNLKKVYAAHSLRIQFIADLFQGSDIMAEGPGGPKTFSAWQESKRKVV